MTKASHDWRTEYSRLMLEKLDRHMENHVSIETGEVVTITFSGRYKYVFTPPQYAAIAEAIFSNPPPNVVWQARITEEMISSDTNTESMIEELDDYVAGTAMEFGVN